MKLQNTTDTNITVNGTELFDNGGYIKRDLVKETLFTAYSRPKTYGGRLFFQEIELIDGQVITLFGDTASTRGEIGRGNVRENLLQREIKNMTTENTFNY